MGGLVRFGGREEWGPAEKAALDRCLHVPGLSERILPARSPIRLSRMIETEIIPRLLLAHMPGMNEPAAPMALTAAEVGDLARVALEQDGTAVLGHVEALRRDGHSLDALFLELLAPTACLLGEMWCEDLCSFADVTIALSRLQQALRALGSLFEGASKSGPGRILLSAVPGDQHSFGLSMLECFFRRDGWDVHGGSVTHTQAELIEIVRHERLDAVGLSLNCETLYERLPPLIDAIRRASLNPSLFIMVGGQYFTERPEHATEAGADTVASDALDALRRAHACLNAVHAPA